MRGSTATAGEWYSLHANYNAIKEVLELIGFSKAEVERCMSAGGCSQKKWDDLVAAVRVSATHGTPAAAAKVKAIKGVRRLGHLAWREMLLTINGHICFICTRHLSTDLELCHDDEIMESHSSKKVFGWKGDHGVTVWYPYAQRVWHIPSANFDGDMSCLKDEAAKCHFGHSKCNTEMDRPHDQVKYLATGKDNAEEHWAELVAAKTPGFGSTLRDHLSACLECSAHWAALVEYKK